MDSQLQVLEDRVAAVTERLALLRGEITKLGGSLESRVPISDAGPDLEDLAGENRRLLGERVQIRERIQALIQEIDRAL